MQVLLVGTDFDNGSDRAFARACEIAQGLGERVHLLHVVEPVDEPGSSDPDTEEFYNRLTAISQAKLQSEMAANKRPIKVTCSVEIGHRVEVLRKVADELDADLVVLGSQPLAIDGEPRLSTAHRFALTSKRPVLLVP